MISGINALCDGFFLPHMIHLRINRYASGIIRYIDSIGHFTKGGSNHVRISAGMLC